MIELKNVTKCYDDVTAARDISLKIPDACVFGMLGTNGAGKSTLFRMMSGVQKPDAGEILIDGESVWENARVKGKVFYISDDHYYFANATPKDMMKTYSVYYPNFQKEHFMELVSGFGLNTGRKVQNFSKGMKKQLAILLGICSGAKYLLCDETFDGLDPVMRKGIKSIFADEICGHELSIIIASHNLRELEDICDYVGILHRGGVILDEDVNKLKCNLHKIQCVLSQANDDDLYQHLDVLTMEKRGNLLTMTVRGEKEAVFDYLDSLDPAFYETLPLSLEEIFIYEAGGVGYDFKNLVQ